MLFISADVPLQLFTCITEQQHTTTNLYIIDANAAYNSDVLQELSLPCTEVSFITFSGGF